MNYFSSKYEAKAQHASNDLLNETKQLVSGNVSLKKPINAILGDFIGVSDTAAGKFSGAAVEEVNMQVSNHCEKYNSHFCHTTQEAWDQREKLLNK